MKTIFLFIALTILGASPFAEIAKVLRDEHHIKQSKLRDILGIFVHGSACVRLGGNAAGHASGAYAVDGIGRRVGPVRDGAVDRGTRVGCDVRRRSYIRPDRNIPGAYGDLLGDHRPHAGRYLDYLEKQQEFRFLSAFS